MNDDPVGGAILFAITFCGAALVAGAALVVGAVGLAGYGVFVAARAGYRAMSAPSVRGELERVAGDRDSAIREITRIRQDATRRMQQISDGNVIDGHAEEW